MNSESKAILDSPQNYNDETMKDIYFLNFLFLHSTRKITSKNIMLSTMNPTVRTRFGMVAWKLHNREGSKKTETTDEPIKSCNVPDAHFQEVEEGNL